MRKWVVRDRDGREIYMTEERWEHIVSRHPYLENHRNDVLATIQRGRRKQQPHDPRAYVYYRPCATLRSPFTGIMVVVTFRFKWRENGGMSPNNFVVTAWGIRWRR